VPTNPLFSTYRAGENRVTSSIMAVFERIDLALVRDIMAGAAGAGDELRAVTFENQVVSTASVPDGRISGRFTWWIETKTARGGYGSEGHDRQQLREHASLLVNDPDATLFVLTPDPVRPIWFDNFDPAVAEEVRSRIIWVSFRQIGLAIEEIRDDPVRLLSEQTRFLLAELLKLFEADGLLTNDDTVIVAARSAWPEYQWTSAYVCQANRTFRDGLTHLGFYADGAIQPRIARIRSHLLSVPFTAEEAERLAQEGDREVSNLITDLLAKGARTEGQSHSVFELSGADAEQTVRLDQPIVNDTKSASGKTWAWTLSQRYTSLDRLRSGARLTSQL
jgi:hypothetical protein